MQGLMMDRPLTFEHFSTPEELPSFLDGRVAKWWLPDAIELIDEVPTTSTGKFSEKDLRDRFAGYRLG